jgi:1,4-alpha-glucan branching enzyme
MIEKEFIELDGQLSVRASFSLPDSVWSDAIFLVGDFNDWQRASHPLTRNRAGHWSLVVELEVGRAYQFRYLCDSDRWLNDASADCFVCNPYGTDNFVVVTDPRFRRYCDDARCG